MSCHHVSSSCIYFHSNEPKWIANDFESSTPHITKSWFQTFNLADGLLILHKAQLTLCQQTIPVFDSEWGRKVDTELQNHHKWPLGMNYITYWWIYNSRRSSYFWEIWETDLRGIDTLDAVRSTGLDLPSTTHAEWVGRATLDPSIRACRWCHPPLQKDKGDKGPKKIHQIALALAWHVYAKSGIRKFGAIHWSQTKAKAVQQLEGLNYEPDFTIGAMNVLQQSLTGSVFQNPPVLAKRLTGSTSTHIMHKLIFISVLVHTFPIDTYPPSPPSAIEYYLILSVFDDTGIKPHY